MSFFLNRRYLRTYVLFILFEIRIK
uniref:Uncharacterized protein n=1 Tax=Anguilla anguilla TaxID=7936 RepID=A0A0E9SF92_ANGAN